MWRSNDVHIINSDNKKNIDCSLLKLANQWNCKLLLLPQQQTFTFIRSSDSPSILMQWFAFTPFHIQDIGFAPTTNHPPHLTIICRKHKGMETFVGCKTGYILMCDCAIMLRLPVLPCRFREASRASASVHPWRAWSHRASWRRCGGRGLCSRRLDLDLLSGDNKMLTF